MSGIGDRAPLLPLAPMSSTSDPAPLRLQNRHPPIHYCRISHLAQNAFYLVLMASSAFVLVRWSSNRTIFVISAASLAVSLQRLIDHNLDLDMRSLVNGVKTNLAFLVFFTLWQPWKYLSQSSAYEHHPIKRTLIKVLLLGTIITYGVSCSIVELTALFDYLRKVMLSPALPRRSNPGGEFHNKLLFPASTSLPLVLTIEGLAAAIFLTIGAVSYHFSEKDVMTLAAFGLGMSCGSMLQTGWQQGKRWYYLSNPGAAQSPTRTARSIALIDTFSRFALTTASAASFAYGSVYTVGASGLCQGFELTRRVDNFQRLGSLKEDYISLEEQENSEFLAKNRAVKMKQIATRITQVAVFCFFAASLIFSLVVGSLENENKAKIWGTLLTYSTFLLGSYVVYKAIERVWKPGENGLLVNTGRFLSRHYNDLAVFLAVAIFSAINSSDDGVRASNGDQYLWQLLAWALWAGTIGLDCGRITDINREAPARLTAATTIVYALTITKSLQNKP